MPESPSKYDACPRLLPLGRAGILFQCGTDSVLVVESSGLPNLSGWARGGHLFVLTREPEENRLAEVQSLLESREWVGHFHNAVADRLRSRPDLLGRVSAFREGLSFMLGEIEADVLPSLLQSSTPALFLDLAGYLLLYCEEPPGREAADSAWERFHLNRYVIPASAEESLRQWADENGAGDALESVTEDDHVLLTRTDGEWQAQRLRPRETHELMS